MYQNSLKIYQSPLQGFTDFDFRKALAEAFGGVDKFFVPYLSYGKGHEIKRSQLRELLPENNQGLQTIPQVLFSDFNELSDLVEIICQHGYPEINLNLGCPYPMVTNKGRGSALLLHPEKLDEMFGQLFSKFSGVRFSVKMRAGMDDDHDFIAVFEVLNKYPLEEVIFHPRTAGQMYDGKANPKLFTEAAALSKHRLVYNGDIVSVAGFQELQTQFSEQSEWMIGRGLLANPALAAQIKGEVFTDSGLREKLRAFHDQLFEAYSSRLDGAGHILQKMNQFWAYFSESFDNPHKAMKLVKKSSNLSKYNAAVSEIFSRF
jgi:tRNA-dihydrouridine synthase